MDGTQQEVLAETNQSALNVNAGDQVASMTKKDIHHRNVSTPSNVDKYQVPVTSIKTTMQYACFDTNSDIDGIHNWYTRCLTNKGGLHQ